MVERLLGHGADPNAARWHGRTSLHLAVRRGRQGIETLLLRYGADPEIRDQFGRTPADWRSSTVRAAPQGRVVDAAGRGLDRKGLLNIPERSPKPMNAAVRETGIKAIDLLAPLAMGGVHRLIGGAGVGKIVLFGELAFNLGPVVIAGTLDRTADVRDFEAVLRELGAWDGAIIVLGSDASQHAAVAHTALALAEARDGWVFADDRLLAAFKAEGPGVPVIGFGPHVLPDTLPDASEVVAQWVLDPARAQRREYPALHSEHSRSTATVEMRHAAIADEVRTAIREGGPRADQLLAWLTQPFHVAEGINGRRGVRVGLADALNDAEALLAGAADSVDVATLRYRGTLSGPAWVAASGGSGV